MGARDRSGLSAGRTNLFRLRRRAAAVLRAEQGLRVLAPAGLIVIAYLAIALLGFGNAWLWLAALTLAIFLFLLGVVRLRPPPASAIDRRIEAASGLRHRPLAAFEDVQAAGDAVLWSAYQQSLQLSLAGARAGAPHPQAAAADPLAVRILLLLLLLAGLIIAGPAAPSRLASAFALPAWPFPGPVVDAWIIPPGYAAAPPLLLTPGIPATALTGSRITVIINGPRHAPPMQLAGAVLAPAALGPTSHRADATLTRSGRLLIGKWWDRLAAWNVTVVAPAAPAISLRGLTITGDGKLALKWYIADPYGLSALTLAVHVAGHPLALPLTYALPPSAGDGGVTLDLTDSPYHDLPIDFSLAAINLANVSGHFDFHNLIVLPGLVLHDPTARALDRLRQRLALEPAGIQPVAAQMHDLAAAPLSAITAAADLQLAVLGDMLADRELAPPQAVDAMLTLVKQIEAGPDFAPARALAKADQALQAALAHGLHGQQPGAALLQSLLAAMHQALAEHLAALRPGTANQAPAPPLDTSALDQLAAKIAADEAAGRTAQAARELQQLQAELHALETAQPMTAQQAAQAQAAQQASRQLSQLTQAEAGILDKTAQGSATPDQQAQLQAALDAIRRQLGQAQLSTPGLAAAARAMDDAEKALRQGNTGPAEAAETAAIQALQRAGAALRPSGRIGISSGQGQGQGQGEEQSPGQNPTGNGSNGAPDEQNVPGLGQPAPNPAGAVEDQIIRRNAQPDLPAATRGYLQRLLDN